jgi:hypothetical protein
VLTPARYELTDCGMEAGRRVLHLLDTSAVDATHAPRSASRYYQAIRAPGRVWLRREGGRETRTVTMRGPVSVFCDCPAGAAGRLCVHRILAELAQMEPQVGRLVRWPRAEALAGPEGRHAA